MTDTTALGKGRHIDQGNGQVRHFFGIHKVAQAPAITPDGERLIWGEASGLSQITVYALELATQTRTR